jgi:hypothetical protein
MAFSDLPLEIVQHILVYAVACRGLQRGLRLQLVCSRYFSILLSTRLIFQSCLLTRSMPRYSEAGSLKKNAPPATYIVIGIYSRHFMIGFTQNFVSGSRPRNQTARKNSKLSTRLPTSSWPKLTSRVKPEAGMTISKYSASLQKALALIDQLVRVEFEHRLIMKGRIETRICSSPRFVLTLWISSTSWWTLFSEG